MWANHSADNLTVELKFDTGIPIVPAHVLSEVDDWNDYPGGLDMPHSGPYTIVSWDNNQKILDLPHKDLRRARAAGCARIVLDVAADNPAVDLYRHLGLIEVRIFR